MFQEKRTNIHTDDSRGWQSSTLDETVPYEYAVFKDSHHLTITDMQWEMARHFSHKASEATVVHALQQLKM